MIYFVRRPGGDIKIGRARNCHARLAGLRAEHGNELELLAVVEEETFSETALHRRFASVRKDGEWFEPSAQLLAFIEAEGKSPPADPVGREDVLVKIDKRVAAKARYVATTKEMPLAEYLTAIIRGPVDSDFDLATKGG